MIHTKGKYRNQRIELDQPLALADGTEVELEIRIAGEGEKQGWTELGMNRLEEEWNNPDDAIYDNWKQLYGI
jgi:hypothetical protein